MPLTRCHVAWLARGIPKHHLVKSAKRLGSSRANIELWIKEAMHHDTNTTKGQSSVLPSGGVARELMVYDSSFEIG